MSAMNFRTMRDFPLFVKDFEDEFEGYDTCEYIRERLEDANDKLTFHSISLESGYYFGVQFFVEEEYDPSELDNDDCRYYFDCCRSVAIRRYHSEINKVERMLRLLAKEFGFDEVYCSAVFSNGAANYTVVRNNERSRLLRAATEI